MLSKSPLVSVDEEVVSEYDERSRTQSDSLQLSTPCRMISEREYEDSCFAFVPATLQVRNEPDHKNEKHSINARTCCSRASDQGPERFVQDCTRSNRHNRAPEYSLSCSLAVSVVGCPYQRKGNRRGGRIAEVCCRVSCRCFTTLCDAIRSPTRRMTGVVQHTLGIISVWEIAKFRRVCKSWRANMATLRSRGRRLLLR